MTEKVSDKTYFEDEAVTAIIPFCEEYTPKRMLQDAIDSVENQVAVDTEVLVVEDNEQRGPAWARNAGLQRAKTRYVAFLDADDIWKETKLRAQLRRMADTGAGMCVDGETKDSPVEFVGAVLINETNGLTSSILIDTEQVDARFDESLQRREDHLFMMAAAMQGGVCFLPKTFIDRTHEDGLSNYVDSTPAEIDEFFQMVVDIAPQAAKYKQTYYKQSYVYLGRLRHFDKEYRAAIRHFIESLRYGPSVDAVGALGITLLTMLYEYPMRSARRLGAGGTHE